MLRYIGLALTFFLGIPQAFAHDAFILDSRRSTPGPRLELIELPASGQSAGKRYRLHVEAGLPRGAVFGVFTKPFDHGFHEVQRGFQLDESGSLVSTEGGAKQRLEDMTFGPGPYPLGAAWEAALVSSDRGVRVFAKTVPYPITAGDGPCKLSLQLATYVGDRFIASGSGFPAGEEVATELSYAGRRLQKQVRASADGTLPPDTLAHRPIGADRNARYTVTARSCRVSLEYAWGEPALIRR